MHRYIARRVPQAILYLLHVWTMHGCRFFRSPANFPVLAKTLALHSLAIPPTRILARRKPWGRRTIACAMIVLVVYILLNSIPVALQIVG